MTTNSGQNMNNEKKYTLIISYIGHQYIIVKKSLTKKLKSINKKCGTIYKTIKVQNYSSLKDETSLMSFIFLKVLVVRTKTILYNTIKQKDI